MAQFAVHIATGVELGKDIKKSCIFRYGLLLGAILPDFDFIPMLMLYIVNPNLAKSFHRSASHSLLLPVMATLLGWFLKYVLRKKKIAAFCLGLALGLLSHTVLDILFWFDEVKVLWPLDSLGISTQINLWKHISVPNVIKRIVGPAAEFLFYGLFFRWIGSLQFNKNTLIKKNIPLLEKTGYVFFGIFVILSLFIDNDAKYDELLYGTTSLTFAPISLVTLWQLRKYIIA